MLDHFERDRAELVRGLLELVVRSEVAPVGLAVPLIRNSALAIEYLELAQRIGFGFAPLAYFWREGPDGVEEGFSCTDPVEGFVFEFFLEPLVHPGETDLELIANRLAIQRLQLVTLLGAWIRAAQSLKEVIRSTVVTHPPPPEFDPKLWPDRLYRWLWAITKLNSTPSKDRESWALGLPRTMAKLALLAAYENELACITITFEKQRPVQLHLDFPNGREPLSLTLDEGASITDKDLPLLRNHLAAWRDAREKRFLEQLRPTSTTPVDVAARGDTSADVPDNPMRVRLILSVKEDSHGLEVSDGESGPYLFREGEVAWAIIHTLWQAGKFPVLEVAAFAKAVDLVLAEYEARSVKKDQKLDGQLLHEKMQFRRVRNARKRKGYEGRAHHLIVDRVQSVLRKAMGKGSRPWRDRWLQWDHQTQTVRLRS